MSSFIRLTNINYLLQDQTTPIEIEAVEDACDNVEVYKLPAKPGDKKAWIQSKSTIDLKGREIADLRIALVNKGVLVNANIGAIHETEDSLFIEATIPEDIADCEYEFALYSTIDPIDCTQFKGKTLQQVIDMGVTLGQVLQCKLEDFVP